MKPLTLLVVALSAALLAAACRGPRSIQTTPEGRTVSGLMNSEREVQAYIARALDPREFAITVTLDEDNAPRFINAHRPRPGLQAVAPLAGPPHTRLSLVGGLINGRPARILVDPTSAANWTSIERARAFGLSPLGPPLVYGVPEHVLDSIRGALSIAPTLQVDVMPVDAVLFYARAMRGPLWPLSRSAAAQEADFVVGWSFLRAFEYVRWDFAAAVLVFSTQPLNPDAAEHVLARLPLEKGYSALVVKGTLEGKTRPFLIDLAGDFQLALDEADMAPVRQVTLGDVVLRELRATTLKEHGLGFPGLARLGLRAIGRFNVTLDNHRNELWIEPPTRTDASEP